MTNTLVELERLRITRLRPEAVLPVRAHPTDAGLDLVAAEPALLRAGGGRATVGTGIAVEIPFGWVGLVCRRSGLAARHGVGVLDGPGVIDSGYRGELCVVLRNSDPDRDFTVSVGDRVAQLVLVPVFTGAVEEVDELGAGDRGEHGFGSTGGFG